MGNGVTLNLHIGELISAQNMQGKKMKYSKNNSGFYGRFGSEAISGFMALVIIGSSVSSIMHPMSFFTTEGTHIPKIEFSHSDEHVQKTAPVSTSDEDEQNKKDIEVIRQLIYKKQQEYNLNTETKQLKDEEITQKIKAVAERKKQQEYNLNTETKQLKDEEITQKIKAVAERVENSESQLNQSNSPDDIRKILNKLNAESSNIK